MIIHIDLIILKLWRKYLIAINILFKITIWLDFVMFNYGDVSEEMKEYFVRGEKRAKQLDNRVPVVFDKDGKV